MELYVSLDQQWNNSSCSGHIVHFILDEDGEIFEMNDTQIEALIEVNFGLEINHSLHDIHGELVYSSENRDVS